MATVSAADRRLRYITMLMWPLSFALLLPTGIRTHHPVPALGMLPMTISAVWGGFQSKSNSTKSPWRNCLMDLFTAVFLAGVFAGGCVVLRHRVHDEGNLMVGTLASSTLLVNFCIHAFFFFCEVGQLFVSSNCPHCQREMVWRLKTDPDTFFALPNGSKESYSRVSGDDQEPRPSSDDETARLV